MTLGFSVRDRRIRERCFLGWRNGETTWQGAVAADVPGVWNAGDRCRLEVRSLMMFEGGELVEWCDVGRGSRLRVAGLR